MPLPQRTGAKWVVLSFQDVYDNIKDHYAFDMNEPIAQYALDVYTQGENDIHYPYELSLTYKTHKNVNLPAGPVIEKIIAFVYETKVGPFNFFLDSKEDNNTMNISCFSNATQWVGKSDIKQGAADFFAALTAAWDAGKSTAAALDYCFICKTDQPNCIDSYGGKKICPGCVQQRP